ncbi:uncharacterized protein [Hyperolius riggenbachi]|uniref:uncharacterized protein n=1 Tax=Hyperolius riggenbachi TaxID=752182 RepID=UPI0035A321E0
MSPSRIHVGFLLLLIPGILEAKLRYAFIFPNTIQSENMDRACLQLEEAQGQSHVQVTLLTSINKSVLMDRTFLQNSVFTCFAIKIPPVPYVADHNLYHQVFQKADLELTIRSSGETIKQQRKVGITMDQRMPRSQILVQTDKPVYKPGQTVKFRIVSIKENFQPLNTLLPVVEIQDPGSNRIGQWRNVNLTHGMADLSYPLSPEPQLGEYTIRIMDKVHTFSVEEYVLPKFEVTLKLPKFVQTTTKTFPVEICASCPRPGPLRPLQKSGPDPAIDHLDDINLDIESTFKLNDIDSTTVNADQEIKQLCRQHRKLTLKHLRRKWNISTLESYREARVLPWGIREKIIPAEHLRNDRFLPKWKAASIAHGFVVLGLIIEEEKIQLTEIREAVDTSIEALDPYKENPVFSKLNDLLKGEVERTQKKIKKDKQTKYLKDLAEWKEGEYFLYLPGKPRSRSGSRPRTPKDQGGIGGQPDSPESSISGKSVAFLDESDGGSGDEIKKKQGKGNRRGRNKRKVQPSKPILRVQPPRQGIFLDLVTRDFRKLSWTRQTRDNLTKGERKALDDLRQAKEVIIRPSDKGGNVVLWSRDLYLEEAERQLRDTNTYQSLRSAPYERIAYGVNQWVDDAVEEGVLDEKEESFLRVGTYRIPVFYLIPKIHKSLNRPPGRPIVSAIDGPTESLAIWIDQKIKRLVASLPSYVQDSRDVLRLINDLSVDPGDLLVGIDVESLYTSIPHEVGLEALRFFLSDAYPDTPVHNDFVVQAMRYVLEHNCFLFKDTHYRQVRGTSMGASCAPAYACLHLGLWERKDVYTLPDFDVHVKVWLRFIDDVLVVWRGSEEELERFFDRLNVNERNIHLTYTYSPTSISFLDLSVVKDGGALRTTTYRKPTAGNTLLHATSHHPPHLIRGIPRGQFLRIRRNCSSEVDFQREAAEMYDRFRDRGYGHEALCSGAERAIQTPRSELLKKQDRSLEQATKGNTSCPSFISSYNSNWSRIRDILTRHWSVLQIDPVFGSIVGERPPLVARRAPSLRDRLVHSDLLPQSNWLVEFSTKGMYKCGACSMCEYVDVAKTFQAPNKEKEWKIHSFINCNSEWTVYTIQCPCPMLYVGMTTRKLKKRISEHVQVLDSENKPLAGQRVYLTRSTWNTTSTHNLVTDENGCAAFTLHNTEEWEDEVSLTASTKPGTSSNPFAYGSERLRDMEGHLTLLPLYSHSNSFLNLQTTGNAQSCDPQQEVQVEYIISHTTLGEKTSYLSLHYLIISNSRIENSGSQEIPVLNPDKDLSGDLTLELPIKADVSSSLHALVYILLPNGEIIADSINIRTKKCFKNQVSVDFSPDEVLPGSDVSLQVKAAPGSLCGLRVVDQSVVLMRPDKELTADKVFSLFPDHHHLHISGDDSVEKEARECVNFPGQFFNFPFPITVKSDELYRLFMDTNLNIITSAQLKKPLLCPDSPESGNVPEVSATPGLPPGLPPGMGGVGLVPGGGFGPQSGFHFHGAGAGVGGMMPGAGAGGLASVPMPNAISETISLRKPEVIRKYFPETWIWELAPIGDSGLVDLHHSVPDTITDWNAGAMCMGPSGFGLSPSVSLRVFQPFFVELALPYSVVRGESFTLKASVFNYLQQCIKVQTDLLPSLEMEEEACPGCEYSSCLCAEESKTFYWNVTANKLGEVNVTVRAEALQTPEMCNNEIPVVPKRGNTDTMIKPLIVKPGGVLVEKSHNFMICIPPAQVGPGRANPEEFYLNIPENILKDSERAYVTLYGDMMGTALQNIDRLLAMPFGCGEQNMLRLAPNIFILQYLEKTSQLTEEIRSKAYKFMEEGYQRQLKYKRVDGSYSAFESDEEGNTWLTAFVLKSFSKAKRYVFIDEPVLSSSFTWLFQNRYYTGCFRNAGRLIQSAMKGGVDDDVSLSAYVTIALLEANLSREAPVVRDSVRCLQQLALSVTNMYTQALLAYVFTLYGDMYSRQIMLNRLDVRAVRRDGGLYWQPKFTSASSDPFWHRASSTEVELTSYVLLALVSAPSIDFTGASQIVKWLSKQQSAFGGFSSTQDTVVALQALAKYAEAVYSDKRDVTVTVTSKTGFLQTFHVDNNNRLLLQSASLPTIPGNYTVSARGSGCVYVQTVLRYNVPPARNLAAFTMRLDVKATQCAMFQPTKLQMTITVAQTQGGLQLPRIPPQTRVGAVSGERHKLRHQNICKYPAAHSTTPFLTRLQLTLDKAAACVQSMEQQRVYRAWSSSVCTEHGVALGNLGVRYSGSRVKSNMAIIEVNVLSGFMPEMSSVELLKSRRQVRKLESNNDVMNLYLDELGRSPTTLVFMLAQDFPVRNLEPATVKVYDYYETDENAVAEYTSPCSWQ